MNGEQNVMNINEIITISAFGLNVIMLGVVAYQTWLTRKSLRAAQKSIEDTTITRQIAHLDHLHWVINVQVDLERWQKHLNKTANEILDAGVRKDIESLKSIASNGITRPDQLHLNKFSYDNMPSWLREIWLSAAQYYYNAIVCTITVWSDSGEPDYYFGYARRLAEGRFAESSHAISKLLGYINNMVPPVMMHSPASINDNEFLTKN
jgi:hypothetical protein